MRLLPYVKDLTLAIGVPWVYEQKCYNTLAVIQDTRLVGFYAKQCLVNAGIYYESRWFSSWQQGIIKKIACPHGWGEIGEICVTIGGWRVGFEICEDAWQGAESSTTLRYATEQVSVIINASASHFEMGKGIVCRQMVEQRSHQYGGVYAYANLLGNEAGRVIYDGSLMVAQNGRLVACGERLRFGDVHVLTTRITSHTTDCQPLFVSADDACVYEEFIAAVSLGLYDYLRKSKAMGFVLSLSGGADSSLCALLVVEMIKRGVRSLGIVTFVESLFLSAAQKETLNTLSPTDQVRYLVHRMLWCVYQEGEHSTKESLHAAEQLSVELGAHFLHWSIAHPVKYYTQQVARALHRTLSWAEDDKALQNIQARSRVPALWMLANATNTLLLTTGNRSEASVGYMTMEGDTAGSVAPLGGVSKHFVRCLLVWAEKHLNIAALSCVNALVPSAELRAHQTDEEELMPYDILHDIEEFFLGGRQAPERVMKAIIKKHDLPAGLAKAYVRKFLRLWGASQWKRERMAPSFHTSRHSVDPKTFARFPILFDA